MKKDINIKKIFEEVEQERDKKAMRFANWLLKQDGSASYGKLVGTNEWYFISGNWWKIWEKFPKLNNWFNHMNMAYSTIGSCYTEFDDEYCYCNECCNIIHYYNNYGDVRHIYTQDSILCQTCVTIDTDVLIEEYTNNSNKAVPDWGIELIEKEGFTCLDNAENETCQIFENGFHPGQNDDPKEIIKNLEAEGYLDKYDFIFGITDTGQFDIHFSLWIREKETD